MMDKIYKYKKVVFETVKTTAVRLEIESQPDFAGGIQEWKIEQREFYKGLIMKLIYAITRKPGKNFAQGITSANLSKPGYELMIKQHQAYVQVLKSLGLMVIELDELQEFPDAHFVEDTAVVTP